MPFCKENNKYSIAKVPLAKGLLSSKYKIGHKFDDIERGNYSKEFNNNVLEKVTKLYSKMDIKNKTSWALKEILKNKVDFVIPGIKSLDQLNSNLELFKAE